MKIQCRVTHLIFNCIPVKSFKSDWLILPKYLHQNAKFELYPEIKNCLFKLSLNFNDVHLKILWYYITLSLPFRIIYAYTERKICLNLFGTRKFVLVLLVFLLFISKFVLQPKRIFICNKAKYIWFKCLLLTLKTHFLKEKKTLFFDLNTFF